MVDQENRDELLAKIVVILASAEKINIKPSDVLNMVKMRKINNRLLNGRYQMGRWVKSAKQIIDLIDSLDSIEEKEN